MLPYLKDLVIIKCGLLYLACGYTVYSIFVVIIFSYIFRFLTSGIKAVSLADIVGKYFLFLQFFFFFRRRKKEGRNIPEIFGIFI
jgi:hypothetical protein